MPTPAETTSDPELRVEIAGTAFAPIAVEGRRHIFMLPKFNGCVTLQSRHAVPADRRPWVDDQRQLGVKVQRMTLSTTACIRSIPIDHPDLGSGWSTEQDATTTARWTNGDAAIVMETGDAPSRFEIELAGTMDGTGGGDGSSGDADALRLTGDWLIAARGETGSYQWPAVSPHSRRSAGAGLTPW